MRWERWQGTMSIIKHKFQQYSSLWFSVVVLVRFILLLLLPRTRAFWHLFPLNLCHIIHTLTVHRFIISSAILTTQQLLPQLDINYGDVDLTKATIFIFIIHNSSLVKFNKLWQKLCKLLCLSIFFILFTNHTHCAFLSSTS